MHNVSDATAPSPTILFEDEHILVINKPAGLVVHGDGRTDEPSVADWALEYHPRMRNVGEPWTSQTGEAIPRPGIVHRLDRETSGVMVMAKTHESFALLKEQFQERRVRKTYRAFVYGAMKEGEGAIDRPIGKSKSDFRKWSAQPGSRGALRDAHTAWERLGVTTEGHERYAYLALRPITGRTHQLRVHLKAIHHPIVCDTLYAPKRPCALGFTRLALHAHTLTVALPTTGEERVFEAPLPEDFIRAEKMVAFTGAA